MQKENRSKKCFVLMPFTVREVDQSRYPDPNHWNEVYEGLIVPAVEKAGLQCERDDEDIGSRLIVQHILEKIETADVVICDLSSHNPNVFLELGWALRADKPYVLIKDGLTTYTFDLNQQYTFSYTHRLQPIVIRKEIEELANAIRRTLTDSQQRYSLVKMMSLSLSAIEAINEGNLQIELLTEIQRRLIKVQYINVSNRMTPEQRFPWSNLLKRGNAIFFKTKESIKKFEESAYDFDKLVSVLNKIVEELGISQSQEFQISVINSDRHFVYHYWKDMVGTSADYQGISRENIYDEIFQYPHGVVAWIDRASNDRIIESLSIRFNIALFSTIYSNWKLVVEVHHKTD